MNLHPISFHQTTVCAMPSGALWWAGERTLIASDLHLGKSGRVARLGGPLLPPYDAQDTLARLDDDIQATRPARVICLGDSFDDLAAAQELDDDIVTWITRLQAGREWFWIEGNHDPGPAGVGGTHIRDLMIRGLSFRHIADPAAKGEISGHYHPKTTVKAGGRAITRRCFLHDAARIILPAYGTYTGGLRTNDQAWDDLITADTMAILVGETLHEFPLSRGHIIR